MEDMQDNSMLNKPQTVENQQENNLQSFPDTNFVDNNQPPTEEIEGNFDDDFGDYDVSGMFDDDDLEVVEQIAQTTTISTKQDLYDGKMDISYFGIIPLIILKEDPNVLTAIVKLTAQNAASKVKLSNIIREAKVFLDHVEIKLKEKEVRDGRESEEAREIFRKLLNNTVSLENAYNLFNYSTSLSEREKNVSALVKGTIRELVDDNKVQEAVAACILTDKFDRQTSLSYAYSLAKKYGSFIEVSSNIDRLVDAYDFYTTSNKVTLGQDPTLDLIVDVLKYAKKSYTYTSEELTLLKELDFPVSLAGLEKYLKSDVAPVLKTLSNNNKSSKSIMEEVYKQAEENRYDKLKQNYATFCRKKIIGELNNDQGRSAVCMYF